MKKERGLLFAFAITVCLLLSRSLFPQKTSPREDLYERLEQVDGGWEKQSMTEVIPLTYTSEGGERSAGAGGLVVFWGAKGKVKGRAGEDTRPYEGQPPRRRGLQRRG